MPVQSSQGTKLETDEELVDLNLDATAPSDAAAAPESLFDRLSRCGNPVTSTPLPWKQLSVVMVVSFSEGITQLILLPFVAFMVTDLFRYPAADVGYYGGWLTSAYFLSQIVSSVVLGQLSDVKGRRLIMLLGIFGNLVTTVIFGLSRVFWLALLARFTCGLINGNIGVIKSYIREITDQSNQARGYTLRSAGYSIGTIIGPILGGALARPAVQFPSVFSSTGLFGYFPFLLPCLASAFISLLAFILSYLYLQETVVKPIVDDDLYSSDDLELEESTTTSEATTGNSTPIEPGSLPPSLTNSSEKRKLGLVIEADEEVLQVELDPEELEEKKPKRNRRQSRYSDATIFLKQLWSRLGFFKKALGEKDVVLSILMYSGVAFVQLGFDEVFAFWAIRSVEQGGIGFSTLQIGTSHAISGVGMLLMQVLAYVPMDERLGTQNTLTLSMAVSTPAYFIVSFASNVASNKALLWLLIAFVMMMKAGFGTIGFAAVNLLVSNAAGSETVGAVNGLSASMAAVARVIAPVFLGSIFAATANGSAGFPFDYHFVFIFISLVVAGIAVASHFALPKSINKRKS